MKINSFSCVIHERLKELGLSRIPPAAIAYIESQMEGELRRLASHRITARSVSLSILKALHQTQTNALSTPAATAPKLA